MIELERREYGPDSTPEEIEMLRSRVNLIDGNVICYKEVYVLNEFQIEVMSQKASELIVEGQDNYIILDLVDSKAPNAPQRKKIRECFSKFVHHVTHTSIYTQNNIINNLAAKFILGSIGFPINSIHRTREEALKAIEKVKNKN